MKELKNNLKFTTEESERLKRIEVMLEQLLKHHNYSPYQIGKILERAKDQ